MIYWPAGQMNAGSSGPQSKKRREPVSHHLSHLARDQVTDRRL